MCLMFWRENIHFWRYRRIVRKIYCFKSRYKKIMNFLGFFFLSPAVGGCDLLWDRLFWRWYRWSENDGLESLRWPRRVTCLKPQRVVFSCHTPRIRAMHDSRYREIKEVFRLSLPSSLKKGSVFTPVVNPLNRHAQCVCVGEEGMRGEERG